MNIQLHFRYHTNESIDDEIDDDDSQLFKYQILYNQLKHKYHSFELELWFCFRNHIYIVNIELYVGCWMGQQMSNLWN